MVKYLACIAVLVAACFFYADAQCGCCGIPTCTCCPQPVNNTAPALKVCSATCADTFPGCDKYASACSSAMYRSVLLQNCRCTCNLCDVGTTTLAPVNQNYCQANNIADGTPVGPAPNGNCNNGGGCQPGTICLTVGGTAQCWC